MCSWRDEIAGSIPGSLGVALATVCMYVLYGL